MQDFRYILNSTNEGDQNFKKLSRYQIWKLYAILDTLELLNVKIGILFVNIQHKTDRQFSDFQRFLRMHDFRYILNSTNEADQNLKKLHRYQIWKLCAIFEI